MTHSPTNEGAEKLSVSEGNDLQSRLANLSPAQRKLLETKLAKRQSAPSTDSSVAANAGSDRPASEPIAIVSMGCRFPGADNPDEYWQLIESARESVDTVPRERWDARRFYDPTGRSQGRMSVNRMGAVSNFDQFDPAFFGIAPREASRMDPQQRLLLEVAWETVENSATSIHELTGSNTGVFIGIGGTDYSKIPSQFSNYYETIDAHMGTGNALSIASARLSYVFDFKGPSFIVDTACSSAMVAIHHALISLRRKECDAAIAGGVNMILTPETTIAFSKARMLSPGGSCRPFDDAADGYVRSEGCGLILLKRLADARRDGDQVLALLAGSAVNQDGRTSGITAPSSGSQTKVIRAALADAGCTIDDIDYVEAHGTGTPLGDPIEIQALSEVYASRSQQRNPLLIGSVKGNIGHTETASGIAGVIKVLAMLKHQKIPAQANFRTLNSNAPVSSRILQVASSEHRWHVTQSPRRAGVSSFGFGGTNAHLIIESADTTTAADSETLRSEPSVAPVMALPISATDPAALADLARRYASRIDHSGSDPGDGRIDDLCFAAATRRASLTIRGVAIGSGADQLKESLTAFENPEDHERLIFGRRPSGRRSRVAMLFTGQGSQYVSMATGLSKTLPSFQYALDQCAEILESQIPVPLHDLLTGGIDPDLGLSLDHTSLAQPAICAVQIALVDSLADVGITPDVVAGHSIGEIAALYAAGALSREHSLRIAAERGEVMGALPTGGTMTAILASADRVQTWIDQTQSSVVIATMNGPEAVVVAGEALAVEALAKVAQSHDVLTRPLAVSHAFHSPLMEPARDRLAERLTPFMVDGKVSPTVTFLSAVTGDQYSQPIDAQYWCRHLVSPVRFADVINKLEDQQIDLAIEIGPAPHLSSMIHRVRRAKSDDTAGASSFVMTPTLHPQATDYEGWIRSVARAWTVGVNVNWKRLAESFPRRRNPVDLPNYPFQRSRFWFETPSPSGSRLAGQWVHPLLGDQQKLADGSTLHNAVLRSSDPNFLADHVVSGSVVVPGAAWIETIRAAAALRLETPFELREIKIHRGLFLDAADAVTVQTRVTGGTSVAKIEVAYRFAGDETEWQSCASATAVAVVEPKNAAATSERDEQAPVIDRPEPIRQTDAAELYRRLADRELQYGSFFQVLDKIESDSVSACASLQLAEPMQIEASQYGLHPALLDGCFQLFAAVDPDDTRAFLPVGVERMTVYPDASGVLPIASQARVKRRGTGMVEEGFQADVDVIDQEGHLISRLEGVQMQRWNAQASTSESDPMTWVHEVRWEPLAESIGESSSASDEPAERVLWTVPDLVDEANNSRDVRGSMGGERVDGELIKTCCGLLLSRIQAVLRQTNPPPIDFVTVQGHQVLSDDIVDPLSAALIGLFRVASNEHPALGLRILDLVSWDDAGKAVRSWQNSSTTETELAYRGGQWYRGRIRPAPLAIGHDQRASGDAEFSIPSSGRYRVRLDGTHRMDGLWAQRITQPKPHGDEVALSIRSVGMNFSDVLKTVGMYPGLRAGEATPLGIEACGTVTAVGDEVEGFGIGDRVMGVVPYGFATDDKTRSHLLVKVPDTISDQEAASIPIVFLTAHHALLNVARLHSGESVLIHAGAGGVGLAAIQVAVSAGANVYATAGNDIKRGLLRELGVPADQVFDSRDVRSIDRIREHTGGRGVDVVLNSLPGDWIEASIGLLAAQGRFLEIGKTDIYQNQAIGLLPFQDNLNYSAIDLDRLLRDRPDLIRELFADVVEKFRQGVYQPCVINTFSLADLPTAIRFMAARKNIGKIVVTPPSVAGDLEQSSGVHLISGGSGSIAQGLAQRLIQRGAKTVALMGRRQPNSGIDRLQRWASDHGATCLYLQADCTDAESAQAAIDSIASQWGHLVSVFHAAGVLDDGLIHEMTTESMERVLSPKVDGAIVLDQVTRDYPLERFVMIGSIASMFGSPGQANYSAANSFLEGFARHRLHRNLPASVVHFGPWAANPDALDAAGMAQDEVRSQNFRARGLTPLAFVPALDLLIDAGEACSSSASIVVDADFGRMLGTSETDGLPSLLRGLKVEGREGPNVSLSVKDQAYLRSLDGLEPLAIEASLTEYLSSQLGAILSMAPESIDPAESLAAFGMDSLMAIELKNTIEARLDISLPISKFMNDPSLNSLASAAAELIAATDDQQSGED